MLIVRNLVAGYGSSRALHGVSIAAAEGSITAVLGPSGAGKTALTSVIAGLLPVISGQVLFGGHDITGMPVKDRIARGICCVPSGRRLFSGMTLAENLRCGAIGSAPDRFSNELDFVLTLVPELRSCLPKPAGALPPGLQSLGVLARALISTPKMLVLDQPSLGLGGEDTVRLYQAISTANRELGIAIVLTEQKLFQALKLAETVCCIDNGRIAGERAALELLADREIQGEFPGNAWQLPGACAR